MSEISKNSDWAKDYASEHPENIEILEDEELDDWDSKDAKDHPENIQIISREEKNNRKKPWHRPKAEESHDEISYLEEKDK